MFIKKAFTAGFALLISVFLHAQTIDPSELTDSVRKANFTESSEITTVGLLKTILPGENQIPWIRNVVTFPVEIEHEGPDPALYKKLKSEMNELKRKQALQPNIAAKTESQELSSQNPTLGFNFLGNLSTDGTPPDNTLAISNGGIIVSAINSSIIYYNTSGTKLYEKTFYDFIGDNTLTGKLYDPTVLYDQKADRFIFLLLHGDNSTQSRLIVCFSKTNNPYTGDWNKYVMTKFTTDFNLPNKWMDFPRAAVSNNELFVTGNIFSNTTNIFYYAVMYQIDKSSGYNGSASLAYKKWQDIRTAKNTKAFSIEPVPYGHLNGTYGPGIYLISTVNTGSDTVYLYQVTNDQWHSPLILKYSVYTGSKYYMAADAAQKGSTEYLSNGDCRILSSFYLNGIIHFVFNSRNGAQYNCAVNYNRLNVSAKTNTSKIIGVIGSDMSYPSVVSASPDASNDADVLIGLLYSGSTIYPSIRSLYVDNNMVPSGLTTVKNGSTYVNFIMGSTGERWGDYSGLSRKFNSSPTSAWMSGCFGAAAGTITHSYNTWIAEIKDLTSGIAEPENNDITEMKVFPNPPVDLVNVEFYLKNSENIDVRIIDLEGRTVKILYQDYTEEGKTVISFNKLALNQGIYLVVVSSGEHILKTVKVKL